MRRPDLRFRAEPVLLLMLALFAGACSGLKYPLDEALTKKTFAPRRAPEEIDLYFSAERVAKTVRTGSSHEAGGDDDGYYPPLIDSGSEEVARNFPIPGAPRDEPAGRYVKLRKLRTNLILREARGQRVSAGRWPDEVPLEVLPSDDMIDDGLGQLREMAAEAGADALADVFAWVVVEESRFGVAGVYEFTVVPRGIVLQGIAIRYEDR
jgi:hypothetical protein